MKVLILNGSPNEKGNTKRIIDYGLSFIKGEVEVLDLYNLKINPCVDCGACKYQENCSLLDDMQAIYQKLNDADCIILASPIYFMDLTPPFINMLSRFNLYYWANKKGSYLKPKKALVILVEGSFTAFDKAKQTATIFLNQLNVKQKTFCLFEGSDEQSVLSLEVNRMKIKEEMSKL